ncbi:MAG TPA: hypothetical protein VE890_15000, partial [Thermoguttaceae bacterium]|nr:hypothetical protein [Thermoguttaceae bacterium]
SSQAATLLSTPPDIAKTTRAIDRSVSAGHTAGKWKDRKGGEGKRGKRLVLFFFPFSPPSPFPDSLSLPK